MIYSRPSGENSSFANEALVIDIELCSNQNLSLASIQIQSLGCLTLSTAFPTLSPLSAISFRRWKLSAVPKKKQLSSSAQKYRKSFRPNVLKQ